MHGLYSWLIFAMLGAPLVTPAQTSDIVIHAFTDGLSGIHTSNPDVKLSVDRDAADPDDPVLVIEYPKGGADPAARDVRCDAVNRDWTSGRAVAFRIKPAQAIKISVSFVDRNRVAYTTWAQLEAGVWQEVRIPFDEIRPNPYFQPAGARTGNPIDVSDVTAIAFAPHDQASGRLEISRLVVIK
jgi:hypothetical protein